MAQARLICSIARQTDSSSPPRPPIFRGERQRQDVLRGEELAEVSRELAGPVDLGGPRGHALVGQHADRIAEELLLLGQPVRGRLGAVTGGIVAARFDRVGH